MFPSYCLYLWTKIAVTEAFYEIVLQNVLVPLTIWQLSNDALSSASEIWQLSAV
jgi:hypothetical protein